MSSESIDKAKEELIQKNLLLLKYKVQEQRLENVWLKFVEAGFNPIMIKGWATALKYPNPADRLYVDVDLVFSTEEFTRAEEFVLRNTFDIGVDLHRDVRHLDSLSFDELYKNSTFTICGNTQIRIPCEEDHLRIIAVHWLNDGGNHKERLWDIYYAVENRKADFDWDKCLSVVNSKRRFWIISAIGISEKYLGLNTENLPFKSELKNIPEWVFKAIEKEWSDEVRLMPLYNYWHNRKELWKQIKKRIPPNPIQATIEVNGAFNDTPRIFYQVADIFKRIYTSWKRNRWLREQRELRKN